jgi:hypothetical protein
MPLATEAVRAGARVVKAADMDHVTDTVKLGVAYERRQGTT